MLALRKNRSGRLVGRITRSPSRNQKRYSRRIFRGRKYCLGNPGGSSAEGWDS